jgi:hypothetical protein
MGKFASTMYRLVLSTLNSPYMNNKNNAQGSNNPVSTQEALHGVRLTVVLSCALLQSLGKKVFGKAAADVLGVSVEFMETVISASANSSSDDGSSSGGSGGGGGGGITGTGGGVVVGAGGAAGGGSSNSNSGSGGAVSELLFARAGLLLTKQVLELTEVLADSTAATAATAHVQAAFSHRLMCIVATGLSNEHVCAELLQAVRVMYCFVLFCFVLFCLFVCVVCLFVSFVCVFCLFLLFCFDLFVCYFVVICATFCGLLPFTFKSMLLFCFFLDTEGWNNFCTLLLAKDAQIVAFLGIHHHTKWS